MFLRKAADVSKNIGSFFCIMTISEFEKKIYPKVISNIYGSNFKYIRK